MIVYRSKVVGELTEDVITKTSPTNTRATMEQIHFLWRSVLPTGEKEWLRSQSGIQYVKKRVLEALSKVALIVQA